MEVLSILDINNTVVNTIVVENKEDYTPEEGLTVGPDGGEINSVWNGTEYIPPVSNVFIDPITFVSNYQGRAALIQAGLFSTVDQMVQTLGTSSLEYQAWEYATNFYRNSPFIISLGAQLGFTSDQIDQLFITANKIL